jgi:hypothetical protein
MAEMDFNTGNVPNPSSGLPPKPRKKKRALLLKILAAAALCLVLLVLLAPTLLSSGPVVSVVLAQVNKQLNGKVEVASLSLGWFTGVKVDGVRVLDAAGAQIAELDHAAVPYPLYKAITGKLAFGDVLVEGLSFDARVNTDGKLNFAELAKSNPIAPSPTPPPSPSPSAPAPSQPASATTAVPARLADLSINLKLTNCHGTYSQIGKPTIYLTKLEGQIGIPNINQPITDQLSASVKIDDQPDGTLTINGSAAVIQQNQIAINTAEVHQTIEVTNLDLQTVRSLIPPTAGVTTLDGTLGMHLAVDITAGKNAAVDAAVTATKPLAFGGEVLKGDTFKTNAFSAAVPKLSATFADGLDHWQSGRIKVGVDAGSSPILLKMDQGQVTVLADLVPQSILNLIAKKQPGSDGQLVVTSSFDLAEIIPQLRHTIPEAEGVLIKTAGLTENLKLVLSPEKAELLNSADSTPVTGVQTLASGQTKQISIPPIHLSVGGTDLGGGGALPNLHGLSLKLQSPFANGDFQGESLSDLHGTLTANLQTLQSEAGQFIDLSKINLAGDLSVDLSGTGKLTEAPYQASIKAIVGLHDLKYGDASGPRVNEPLTQFTLNADLQGSPQTTVESAKNISVALTMGAAGAPTVDLLAEAPTVSLVGGASGSFNLSRFSVDLAKLQKELRTVPAGSTGTIVNQGVLTLSSTGQFSPKQISIGALALGAENLFVARQLASGEQVAAVSGEAVHLNLAADLDTSNGTAIRVKSLTLNDVGKILDIHKSGDSDFVLTANPAGAIAGSGQLAIEAQLGSINQIAKVLGQTEVVAKTGSGNVQSGKLTGTLAMSDAGANKTGVGANLNLDSVVVTTDTGTLPPQSATVLLKATADQSANSVTVDQAQFQSNLATANLTHVNLSLAAKSVFDQVQSAHWQLDVPDLKPVMDLANAFSPPAKPAAGDKSLPPLAFDGGAISVNGDLSHEAGGLQFSVNDLTTRNVAFTRGDIHYAAKPVDVKLVASVQTGDGEKLIDQIRQVQITQLTGNLGIATLSMPTPISISSLSSNPVANGKIQLVGNLTDLTELLAATKGEKPDAYPYRGDYTLTENIATQNIAGQESTIALSGGIQIAKFQSYSGSTVNFSEDLVNIANDVSLTSAGADESVAIKNFTAAMQSSGAANVSLANGSINHLNTSRDMQLQLNVNYDLAKLWPVIQPMMGEKYKTLKIAGQFQKQFNVTGSYPANVASTAAIKSLHADGDLAVSLFDYNGLNLQNFILPFTLDQGHLLTVYVNKPAGQNTAAAAVANGGTLDLGNLDIDLTQDPPRLTTPGQKVLVKQMTINPLFSSSYLAKVLNNPLFTNAQKATGLLDLTIVDCTQLPLGNLVTLPSPENAGKADLLFSLTELNIGVQGISGLASALKQDSFTANIKDGTVSIAKGISTQHMSFATGKYSLDFDGKVRLADEAFIPLNLSIGPLPALFGTFGIHDSNIMNNLPDRVVVPVEGTVSHANVRLDKAFGKAVQDAAGKAITNGLFGGNKNGQNNSNPLGGLLQGLEKKKKKQSVPSN